MAITELPYGSVREIPTFAWLITCYTRAYIYTGAKSGLKAAVSRIAKEPMNAGSTVHVKLMVK